MKAITIRLPVEKEYLRAQLLLEMVKNHADWQIVFEPSHPSSPVISVTVPSDEEIGDGAVAKSCLIEVQTILHKNGITL